jgi:protein gp37
MRLWMGDKVGKDTGIEWTDSTHNFWYGCRKVSQGCKFCYAEREMGRYRRDFHTVTRAKEFDKPRRWKQPAKVFVNSWSDFFIEDADAWRDDAWGVIRDTRDRHTYQILTKRPERIGQCLPDDWGSGWANVWLGVSVENKDVTDRLKFLQNIPAAVRFVSFEPLIGPIVVMGWELENIHWAIVGGESGPNARPMKIWWVNAIISACRHHNVAFFMKQLGGWPDKRGRLEDFPPVLRVREFPNVTPAGQLEMF